MIVTLLGRSNVGKSSLFNALAGSNVSVPKFMKSVVSSNPGTTRDAKYGQIFIKGKRITLVDTGGIESAVMPPGLGSSSCSNRFSILEHALKTAGRSDLVLFVVDGQEGITPLDMTIASNLKDQCSSTSSVLKLVVNKLDSEGSEEYYEAVSKCISDCYSLGLGDPIFVSTHDRHGAQRLRSIISKSLNISSGDVISRLERLALTESIPKVNTRLGQECDTIQDPDEIEIDQSLRVCSSFKIGFTPNDRWLRHLFNVCDSIPFARDTDGKYIVPSPLSPGEIAAKMYIPKEVDAEDEAETDSAEPDIPLKTKFSIDTKPIRPLRVVLLGSVGGCQSRLAALLAGSGLDVGIEDKTHDTLSPNWHQFTSEWQRHGATGTTIQPMEIYIAAALNLGGSLGRVSSAQTMALLRRSDIAIMCIGDCDETNTWRVVPTKKETAWLTRIIRLHKPSLVVTPVSQHPNRKMVLDMVSKSHEFESIRIHPLQIVETTSDTPPPAVNLNRTVKRIQRDVISLADSTERVLETSVLNNWLRSFLAKWPPPWHEGSKVNVKFAAQCATCPPTFVVWSNVCASFPQHYLRQMKRAMSEEFGFQGIPLKFILRTTAQPKSTNRRSNLSWRRKLHRA
ncbi:ribosome-binding GTPase family protein [Babesia bovis T2Bo]|uniref:GTPase, putative n=1 Tax=Babesia bovis TaxID=5865 RepID=A7ARG1_BABBO|nr:ribosome-binding GTPase family protein [Babesia bovis T2Bo]EDO07130.1 ribosome-binding GTPase family protein [Babesia bovis T2Bo]|eukprot:XP_001610698.1 GTPase [Babesia bovis T2Bo]